MKKERTGRKGNQSGKACEERQKEQQSECDDRFTIRPENSVKRS